MAKKTSTAWFCSNCGAQSSKWAGRCPACGEWNTLVEERVVETRGKSITGVTRLTSTSKPTPISQIEKNVEERIKLPSKELNRVLGGGLVKGSIVLIGGEPGIGKSTLVLQNLLAIRSRRILYVSGEESATQLKMRADRIGHATDNCIIFCETSLESILEQVKAVKPDMLVIDSIQTIASETLEAVAGSVSQVRECAAALLRLAKETDIPVLIVGHITKEGSIAGPKVLEHIVDAVLQFEGDRQNMYRILRPIKNRFGSTSELGIYEMCRNGLREVTNPSEVMLSHSDEELSGMTVGVTIEGIRPFLIEIQALVSSAAYGIPQRSVNGFDSKRMNMLLAVLEKRVGFKLAQKDVFLNIAGGFKVSDPALDLPVICAILSSNVDMPVSKRTAMAGEIGLSGEIRPVMRLEQRIVEAEKMGMEQMIVPCHNLKGIDITRFKLQLIEVSKVEEAFRALFS